MNLEKFREQVDEYGINNRHFKKYFKVYKTLLQAISFVPQNNPEETGLEKLRDLLLTPGSLPPKLVLVLL